MRIVAFVGSPVDHDEKEVVKVAKRLKKEKVNVDIVSFGEDVRKFHISCWLHYRIFRLIGFFLFTVCQCTSFSFVHKHNKWQRR